MIDLEDIDRVAAEALRPILPLLWKELEEAEERVDCILAMKRVRWEGGTSIDRRTP